MLINCLFVFLGHKHLLTSWLQRQLDQHASVFSADSEIGVQSCHIVFEHPLDVLWQFRVDVFEIAEIDI